MFAALIWRSWVKSNKLVHKYACAFGRWSAKMSTCLYYLLRCRRSSKSRTRHLSLIMDKIYAVAMTTHVCWFECTHHAPYSADLAPSDCHMFLNLKKQLDGVHYTTNDTMLTTAAAYLKDCLPGRHRLQFFNPFQATIWNTVVIKFVKF